MPYPVYREIIVVDGTPSSVTVELPTSAIQVNDLIIICLAQDNATGPSTPSGWTALDSFALSGGAGLRAFRRIATGSDTNPTFNGAADDWIYEVQVWRDADTTTPIEATSRRDWNTVATTTTNTLTTTTSDAVVLMFICGDSDAYFRPQDDVMPMSAENTANAVGLASGYKVQTTAGAVSAISWYVNQADEGGNLLALAIRNKSGGAMPPNPGRNLVVFDQMYDATGIGSLSPLFATIGGVSVNSAITTGVQLQNLDPGRGAWYARMGSADSNTNWSGGVRTLPATTDLSNAIVSIPWRYSSMTHVSADGNCVVFVDTSGNWAAYRISKKSGIAASPSFYMSHVDVANATPFDSVGTINWTLIDRIAFAYRRFSTATLMYLEISALAYSKASGSALTGGSSAAPVTLATHAELANSLLNHLQGKVGFQGAGQLVAKHDIQFGDGSTPTYVDLNAGSIESPPTWNYNTRDRFWNVGAGRLSIRINACATCTMRIRNCVIAPQIAGVFTIDSASSTSATYEFSAAFMANMAFTSKTGITVAGATFRECLEIDAKGGTFSGCNIRLSKNANAAMKVDDGASIQDCVFAAANASDYGIRIPAAGDYYLEGTTFSGYTTDINVTATTGTVTLHLELGQDVPTYTTAGATVDIDQPIAGTKWTNADLGNGTTVLVRNIDTATTIDFATTSGGTGYTITLIPGTDYTAGDVIEIRQSRKSGTSYFKERTSRIITTVAGGDLVEADDLESCTVCDALVLDGEDYDTNFDLDYTDDELDIDTAGNWQTGWLMTWWKWQMTLQTAMEEFWGAWEVLEDGSFYNNVGTLSSYLDITATGDSVETTGRRIHRSDGARPIRSPTTGGGAIDVSWRDPVTVVATGSGVLPSDVTDIATAVWEEVLETGFSASRIARTTASAVAGKTSGGPSTFTARNLSDTQDQITGTADASGNRSTATYGT